jgi:hypothetical protein
MNNAGRVSNDAFGKELKINYSKLDSLKLTHKYLCDDPSQSHQQGGHYQTLRK